MPRFSDSVALICATFKKIGSPSAPEPQEGRGDRCRVILAGGEPPPARQGLGPELLLEFRPVEQADAVFVGPHQSRKAPILKVLVIRKGEHRYSSGRR